MEYTTFEELAEILQQRFDDRYVLQKTCDGVQKSVSSKLATDNTRIELLVQQQKINNWLTLGIASGIIALVIKVFLGG